MAIRIKRNAAGNCITFEGSSNPVYWNACLSGEIDATDSTLVNIVNDIATGQTGVKQYEFFRIPFGQFEDANGLPFANAQDVVDYLALVGNVTQGSLDVNGLYGGVWNASTNTPDILTGSYTPENGEWYYVSVSGTIDLGAASGSYSGSFNVNDIVKYASSSAGTFWERLPNETVRVEQLDQEVDGIISGSALTQFDFHVDSTYAGVELGTAVRPFMTVQAAVAACTGAGPYEILVNGEFDITSSIDITNNAQIHFKGTEGTKIKYASYNQGNGNIFNYTGTNYAGELVVRNIDFQNAGGFAISAVSASKVDIDECTFTNNGWSGTGVSLTSAESGSTLGFNSTTGSLQTFYAAQCSEGGAIFVGEVATVEITDNTINNNNKGIEIIDSGYVGATNGFGFIARNKIYNNVSIGIDLESSTADSTAGCKNFTVYNNSVSYHGDTGIKIEGGIDNTVSLGVLKGNWNAGIELSSVSNTRIRDLDLDNNNRAGVDAEGDEADGLSSLQIEGDDVSPDATFIAEVFNVKIHNTNLGSSAVKCGLLIKSEVGNIVGGNAIIKIDNVGFIEQDYALDIQADLDNLLLTIGQCEYIKTRIKAVRFAGEGSYSEIPFSNLLTSIPYVDFKKDTVAKSILILDGQNGEVINTYYINSLRAVTSPGGFDIIIKDSKKRQLQGLSEDRVFINGVAETGTLQTVINNLNAFFEETDSSAPEEITTPHVDEDGVAIIDNNKGNIVDPAGDNTYGSSFSSTGYNHAVVYSEVPISKAGEYYSFQINQEGIIGMGVHKSGSTGIYALSELGDGTGNGNYGMYWSTWFHPTPNGPWTYYGEKAGSTSIRSGWYSFDDSSTGADWLAGNNVSMRVGIDEQSFLYLSYYDTTSTEFITISRCNVIVAEGEEYHLAIKLADPNVRVYDTPKVHLLSEPDAGTGSVGTTEVALFGDATGTLGSSIITSTGAGENDGFVTEQAITASGQYFQFTVNSDKQHYVGLTDANEFPTSSIKTFMDAEHASGSNTDPDKFFFYGGQIGTGGKFAGFHGRDPEGFSAGYDNVTGSGFQQSSNTHYRAGIDTQGRCSLWQSNDGVNFVLSKRHVQAVPGGVDFRLLWKGSSAAAEFQSISVGQLASVPSLTFHAIESPDGQWHYPLFATAEEAEYFDAYLANPTGSGNSHTHVYVDDLSGQTWYMPDSGSAMNSSVHPTGSYLSSSNWNYVATDTDSNYAPAAFNQSINIQENHLLNLQIVPADATFTTQVVGMPSWMTYSNGYLQGTAPYVPYDDVNLIQVNRTNAYGTTNGTLTLTVTDNVAGSAIAGGTVISGSNTLAPNQILPHANGALVEWDTVLGQGQEMVYTVPSSGNPNPSIGILSTVGENTLSNYDVSISPLATSGGSSTSPGNNFAWRSQWALRYVTFGGYLGAGSEKYQLTGWSDNSIVANSNGYMLDVELKLEYSTDGYIRFYRDGVLLKTSANTFSGDQTIYFAGFDEANTLDIPSNLVIRDTAYTGGAISGWTYLTGSSNLSSSSELNPGSAVQLDLELRDGERIIFRKQWIEANVLPFMDEDSDSTDATAGEQSVFLGVLRDGADITDGITQSDFEIAFEWYNSDSDRSNNNHRLRTINVGTQQANIGIGSKTNALYDFAFDNRGGTVEALATLSSNGNVTTELRVAEGGTWNQSVTSSTFTAGETVSIVIGTRFGGASISNTALSRIDSPLSNNELNVSEDTFSLPLWVGPASSNIAEPPSNVTLNAGQTYKFYMDDSSIESTDILDFVLTSNTASVYTTGVTSSGVSGSAGALVEFAIPQNVPPISARWRSGGGAVNVSYGLNIAGSTYTVPVTGITLEGPAVNQTGTNLFNDPAVDSDGVVWGWLSIDEQLNAGQRLVLDNAFLVDLTDAMPNNSGIFIGLKSSGWSVNYRNNSIANATVGGARFAIYKYSSADIRVFGYVTGATTIGRNYGTNGISNSGLELALDLTNSGNNIRLMMADDRNSSDDVNTTPYADWGSSYKVQTGDQSYGLSAIDVMFLGDGNVNSSGASGEMDSADVDWTGLSEISVPTAPVNNTSWTKALDFSGGSERAAQAGTTYDYVPIMMGGRSGTHGAPLYAGYTSAGTNSRPWATTIVFKSDRHSSNQHLWNVGQGASSGDNNVYVRHSATGGLYLGWGREGSGYNECLFASGLQSSVWYGIYIGFTGERLSGADATAANLADCFDIRLATSTNSWNIGTNRSTTTNWISTGVRMDRVISGELTIGGRGANRTFHGKVASFVSTTLQVNVPMPTDAEISKMITDPTGWVTDYKIGNQYRRPGYSSNTSNFQLRNSSVAWYEPLATQVWLMGDGTNDSYSNMIRNQINPADQNYTKLNLISMVSNDIETVSISGLT